MKKNESVCLMEIFGIPKKIKIHGLTIIIEEGDFDANWMGYYEIESQTIRIRKDLSVDDKWETLFHELGHAIIRTLRFNQAISQQLEEVMVDNFGMVFKDFLKNTKIKLPKVK